MTEPVLFSAAPVFQVDGQVKGEIARDLLRLEVEETTAGLRALVMRLLAHGPTPQATAEQQLYLDGTVDFGKRLEVTIGHTDAEQTIFKGVISAIEADYREGREPHVLVFAEDRLMDLRMTRRSRTWEQVSDADIAAALASNHSLSSDTDADGPTYDFVQQFNQSDLAFLRDRARLIQAEVWIEDDTLKFKTRDKRAGAEIRLELGEHIIELSARADLAHQRTLVTVSGYDAQQREAIEEEAGEEAVAAEVSGGRTGPQVLARAFGDRVSMRVREAPLEGGEASAWARAEMLRRARGFVTAVGVTRGTPEMTVGSRLRLEGVGRPFAGPGYYVTRVCHTYDLENGHRTRFEAERATIQEGA